MGTAFRNVGVTRFNELADFTSLQSTVSYVFEGSQIESIIFPEGFENLNAYTFAKSAVQKVILPTTTLTIGSRCFFNGSCAIMILMATSPPTLNLGSYSPTPGSVYVPDDSVEDYKAATNWSSIASKIYPLSEFTE